MRDFVARFRSLLRGVRRGGGVGREMDDEFRAHIDMRAEDLARSGLPAEEARRRARLEFGSVARFAEEGRSARGLGAVDALRGDVRYALRSLGRSRGFTAVAIVTLALGIGANTAIFSVVHETMLRPLPYPGADRIVTLHERGESGERVAVAEANLKDWRESARSFAAMAYHWNPEFQSRHTVLGGDAAARVWVTGVSEDFFAVFGVEPASGRSFDAHERQVGGPPVALVSHGFWRAQLGGRADVLGTPLDMLGSTYQIIGVLPPGFAYPAATDIWVSIHGFPPNPHRGAKNNAAVARLDHGATLADAQRELDLIGARLVADFGAGAGAAGGVATPLRDELVGAMRQPLLILSGAAALLLLIACTNLTSTLLARGAARERELAIRTAIGARGSRLVRQLLTESLVLAFLGTIAGIALAVLLLRVLDAIRPAALDSASLGLSAPVLAFSLLLTLATTLLFGLAPALRAARDTGAGDALRAGARGNAGDSMRGPWGALVAAEVALAVMLLAGSGLLLRSFAIVIAEPPGFDAGPVLTAEVSLPPSRYGDDPQLIAFYGRALDALRALPGVTHAGLIQHVPLGGVSWSGGFHIDGHGPSAGPAGYRVVSPGYFEAMGINILRGRAFDDSDRAVAPHVAVINQSLAEREWPGVDPVGRRIGDLANEPMSYRGEGDWLTIIGVVADVRQDGLLAAAEPEIFVNVMQRPDRAREAVLTLRTSVPPASITSPVRARLHAIDAQVPAEITTMQDRVFRSVADRRFHMLVLALFASLALLLAAVGIYGVVSYAVTRRTREIGIRLALGATPRSVRAMLQTGTLRLVLIGAAAGTAGALALGRLLHGLLWGVQPGDPLTLVSVLVTILAAAWLASFIPARRTTRVDPLITMRGD